MYLLFSFNSITAGYAVQKKNTINSLYRLIYSSKTISAQKNHIYSFILILRENTNYFLAEYQRIPLHNYDKQRFCEVENGL
jgi:hypothetical protein